MNMEKIDFDLNITLTVLCHQTVTLITFCCCIIGEFWPSTVHENWKVCLLTSIENSLLKSPFFLGMDAPIFEETNMGACIFYANHSQQSGMTLLEGHKASEQEWSFRQIKWLSYGCLSFQQKSIGFWLIGTGEYFLFGNQGGGVTESSCHVIIGLDNGINSVLIIRNKGPFN